MDRYVGLSWAPAAYAVLKGARVPHIAQLATLDALEVADGRTPVWLGLPAKVCA